MLSFLMARNLGDMPERQRGR